MKSRKIMALSAVAVTMATAVSCTQAPIDTVSPVVEEYTREFIKEFGIPAPGHDFAMATSAGLKVKTATGGHVIVTAEIEGKEYLFADLNVPAGTHALPVTIPRNVTTLKVKNGMKTFEAGVNDLVDIDADEPGSRGWMIDGYQYDLNYMPYMTGLSGDGIDNPMIAFRPKDLLDRYFKSHPVGAQNSTDYYYQGCNKGEGYADTDADPHNHLFFGETNLGSYGDEFMIFPIWWKKNAAGNKNYKLCVHQAYSFAQPIVAPFCDLNNPANPFPYLKYYTGDISEFLYTVEDKLDEEITVEEYGFDIKGGISECHFDIGDIVYDRLAARLDQFIASSGDNAYSPDDASLVISSGLRIKFNAHDYFGDFGMGMCLISDGPDGVENYSFTMPAWNQTAWGGNYFDENLNHLFFPYVSTMQFPLSDINCAEGQKPAFPDPEIMIWQKPSEDSEKPLRVFYNTPDPDNKEYGTSYKNGAFLVGFSSPAQKPADTETVRDYTDLILLVVPMGYVHLVYQGSGYPEPYVWTMAVEDLGGTDDWDFNDAVFHFTDVIGNLNSVNMNNLFTSVEGPADAVSARVITVWPEATGGTMPIYITFTGTTAAVDMPRWGADKMYSETNKAIMESLGKGKTGTFVVGTEVHKWLGTSNYTQFVNVGATRSGNVGQSVQFAIPEETLLSYSQTAGAVSEQNKPLYGFALLVDKDNTLGIDTFNDGENGLKLLPDLTMGEGTYLIGAPDENGSIAPQMLLISDGDGSWEWPTERTKISDAYPDFNDWISNISNSEWMKNPTEGKVTKK